MAAQIAGVYAQLRARIPPYLWVYCLLAFAVLLPLLGPGYILTLDMVFTPHLPLPEQVSDSYLLKVGLHFLNVILPSQIIQKMLLFLILVLSGVGMHRLSIYIQKDTDAKPSYATWAAYIAGTLYMINPFTYSRFMAGQYAVLAGYACIPFFVRAMLGLLEHPSWSRSVAVAVWATVIGGGVIPYLGPNYHSGSNRREL